MDAPGMTVTEMLVSAPFLVAATEQAVNPPLENWVNSRVTSESASKAVAIVNGR